MLSAAHSFVFVVTLFSLIFRLLNSYTFKNDDISDIFLKFKAYD